MTGQNSFWFANPSTDFYTETIDQSYRIQSSNLSRTPSSDGNRRTFTVSVWVKRTALGNLDIFSTGSNSYNNLSWTLRFSSDDNLYVYASLAGISNDVVIVSKATFRDMTNWYHFVCAYDSTQGTASNRVKLYANGTQLEIDTGATNHSYGNQNYDTSTNDASYVQRIGRFASADANQFSGYFAEFNFIDGTALDPTSFGETKNGVWIPKEITGLTYGTNGFRLTFADSSSLGDDTSGNGNDYTASGLASTDVLLDSPTNNFATLNKLQQRSNSSATFSEGNLKAVGASASVSGIMTGTFGVSSGKWYWEVLAGGSPYLNTGVVRTPFDPTSSGDSGILSNEYVYLRSGNKYNNNSSASYGASYADGDIIGVALDLDNDTLTFYKNNSSQGTAYSSLPSGTYLPIFDCYNGSNWTFNAGQDSSFAGAKTAQGNADGNGVGDFYYSPPSDHLALCSSNLPDTTLSPNQAEQATDYFNTVLYTGNGTGQTISGVGFQPDWTWNKNRDTTDYHILQDSSRGAGKELFSNTVDDEETYSTSITSWNTDGFVLGSREPINANSETYVSWNWKANGGTTSSNTDGTITSTVQASTEAGFSIVLYASGASGDKTVGHGLTSKPEVIITKSRDASSSYNWSIFHEDVASTVNKYLIFDTDALSDNGSPIWGSAFPTSTVFGIRSGNGVNASTNCIAYCFHSVEGYSKFGTYTGNGSTDGTFIYLGFKPAWFLLKRSDTTGNWLLYDNKRDPDNRVAQGLFPNLTSAEVEQTGGFVDFVSNGVKLKEDGSAMNASGGTFVYFAFAEQPFKFSNAR